MSIHAGIDENEGFGEILPNSPRVALLAKFRQIFHFCRCLHFSTHLNCYGTFLDKCKEKEKKLVKEGIVNLGFKSSHDPYGTDPGICFFVFTHHNGPYQGG